MLNYSAEVRTRQKSVPWQSACAKGEPRSRGEPNDLGYSAERATCGKGEQWQQTDEQGVQ